MVLSKEEFKEKLSDKEFAKFDPELVDDVMPENQLINHIKALGLSKKCIAALVSLNDKIKVLHNNGLILNKNILVISSENTETIIKIIVSILVNNDICDNYLYQDYGFDTKMHNIRGIAEHSINSKKLEDDTKKARFNVGDNYHLFCCNSMIGEMVIEKCYYVFPFIIEDKYDSCEIKTMIETICRNFEVGLIDDVEDTFCQNENSYILKQRAYKLLIDRMNTEEMTSVKLSEIINNSKEIESLENQPLGCISFSTFDNIIGLEPVKTQIARLVKYFGKNTNDSMSKHMAFLGNPGTGKTIMARCLAKKLYDAGVIKKNLFIETDRGGLCAEYVGQTAIKTRELFNNAKGGVLFIDEAYALSGKYHDYGYEALTTLMKEMEDNRESTVVIFAGYQKEMEKMLDINPGLKSRIQFQINFPDYSINELYKIFEMTLGDQYIATPSAKIKLLELFEKERKTENFANGRFVRNVAEKLKLIQCERSDGFDITIEDVERYILEFSPKIVIRYIGFN